MNTPTDAPELSFDEAAKAYFTYKIEHRGRVNLRQLAKQLGCSYEWLRSIKVDFEPKKLASQNGRLTQEILELLYEESMRGNLEAAKVYERLLRASGANKGKSEATEVSLKPLRSYQEAWESLTLFPKQAEAIAFLEDDHSTEVLYGGAAGGAKSFLGCCWQIARRLRYPGTRGLIGRAELKNLKQTTLNTFFEVAAKMGLEHKHDYQYKAQEDRIVFANGSEILLKDLFYYPSDPEFTALGSLEITDAFVDEAGEISRKAFMILGSRIRYKLGEYGLVPKILLTCNPARNWLHTEFFQPWKRGELPDYRAFIQALIDDNQDASFVKIYKQQLSRLDLQTRKRLMAGDWDYLDEELCLFPQSVLADLWEAEANRGTKRFLSADVARFGSDLTVIGVWEGLHLAEVRLARKQDTAQTSQQIRQLAKDWRIPPSAIVVDSDGIGGGVVDQLGRVCGFQANASPLPQQGQAQNFSSLKAQCFFKLAEVIESGRLSIARKVLESPTPWGKTFQEALGEELSLIKRKEGERLSVQPKETLKNSLGRSPDLADMLMMRMLFELRAPVFSYH